MRRTWTARLTSPIVSPAGRRSYIPARLLRSDDGGELLAQPLGASGTHLLAVLSEVNALAVIDEDVTEMTVVPASLGADDLRRVVPPQLRGGVARPLVAAARGRPARAVAAVRDHRRRRDGRPRHGRQRRAGAAAVGLRRLLARLDPGRARDHHRGRRARPRPLFRPGAAAPRRGHGPPGEHGQHRGARPARAAPRGTAAALPRRRRRLARPLRLRGDRRGGPAGWFRGPAGAGRTRLAGLTQRSAHTSPARSLTGVTRVPHVPGFAPSVRGTTARRDPGADVRPITVIGGGADRGRSTGRTAPVGGGGSRAQLSDLRGSGRALAADPRSDRRPASAGSGPAQPGAAVRAGAGTSRAASTPGGSCDTAIRSDHGRRAGGGAGRRPRSP
ncbi:hypothetical protein L7F22_008606 [Adiantum nelumboides]|nr:hypothetical protein [Adiantum nelumboides]